MPRLSLSDAATVAMVSGSLGIPMIGLARKGRGWNYREFCQNWFQFFCRWLFAGILQVICSFFASYLQSRISNSPTIPLNFGNSEINVQPTDRHNKGRTDKPLYASKTKHRNSPAGILWLQWLRKTIGMVLIHKKYFYLICNGFAKPLIQIM